MQRKTAEPTDAMMTRARFKLRRSLREELSNREKSGILSRLREFLGDRKSGMQVAWMAVLLLAGFLAGRSSPFTPESVPEMVRVEEQTPGVFNVNTVQFEPNSGQITVQYNEFQTVTVTGDLSDPEVRRVLSHAIRSDAHPGRRLAAVKALSSGGFNDPLLESALIYAVETDSIAGLRLKAAKVLATLEPNKSIQQTFIRLLLKDDNPAVRMQALEALQQNVPQSELGPVFRNASLSDENEYVRLEASRILEQISYPEL
jgi:hypothetical protein